VQLVVIDAEVVRDLVDDGDLDLLDELLLGLAHVEQGQAEDEDPVRQLERVVGLALGERDPVVQTEQVVRLTLGRGVLDQHHEVLHE
jgi:hypothetical protein